MTITTEEWMQHRRDGLTDALVDRGYPNAWVGIRCDDGWFTLAITRHLGDHPFVTESRDLSQAYRDGLAYINSLLQMEAI